MRHPLLKRRLCIIAAIAAALLGSAWGQSWAGIRTGYPLGFSVHYGLENGLGTGTDFRVSFNAYLREQTGNQLYVGLGLDVFTELQEKPPFSLYGGGGVSADIGPNVFNESSALIDVHGLLGGEFRLYDLELEQFGMFAELTLGAGIGVYRNSVLPTFGGAVGFNYHF
jgi:hypothetical protein